MATNGDCDIDDGGGGGCDGGHGVYDGDQSMIMDVMQASVGCSSAGGSCHGVAAVMDRWMYGWWR